MRKKTLLIGAGFSANFGAPLAKDICSMLFSNKLIQKSASLKATLLNYIEEYDFESFYHDVQFSGCFSEEDKKNITTEVHNIFGRFDERLFSYISMKRYVVDHVSIPKILGFLLKFSLDIGQGNGCIFTLNQDTFIERLCKDYFETEFTQPHIYENIRLLTPGAFDSYPWSTYTGKPIKKEQRDNCINNIFEARDKDEITLFKLHGSYNWRVENDETLMIIGRDKKNIINKFPMLNEYMKIFEKTVCQAEIDILIIGYSFSDPHINEILNNAVKLGARLFPIDIQSLCGWREFIKNKKDIQIDISENLCGYSNLPFKDYFLKTKDENKNLCATVGAGGYTQRSMRLIEYFNESKFDFFSA